MTKSFRTDLSLSRSEWGVEFKRLHRSLLLEVYRFPARWLDGYPEAKIDLAYEHTNFTPAAYLEFEHSPLQPANRIGWGQKAREKRWKKWAAANGVVCTRSTK